MNVQLADKLLARLTEAEAILVEIETEITKLAPDLYSNVEAKKNVLVILKYLMVLKDDLNLFREGKTIINPAKVLQAKIEKLQKKDGFDNFKDLFGPGEDFFGGFGNK